MRPGCLFLNNRYHDPQLGVFISVDPLVASTGEPYIYAGGNPTTLSDPSGLCPDGCVIEVAAGVFLVVGVVAVYVVVCTGQNCSQSLADSLGQAMGTMVDGAQAAGGAVVDAGQAVGGAVVDSGQAIGSAASGLFDGAVGLFKDDDDRLPDPHGLEDFTGNDPDKILEDLVSHIGDRPGRQFSAEEWDQIEDALHNPDAPAVIQPAAGDRGAELIIRVPGTKITVIINQNKPKDSTVIKEPPSRAGRRGPQ